MKTNCFLGEVFILLMHFWEKAPQLLAKFMPLLSTISWWWLVIGEWLTVYHVGLHAFHDALMLF